MDRDSFDASMKIIHNMVISVGDSVLIFHKNKYYMDVYIQEMMDDGIFITPIGLLEQIEQPTKYESEFIYYSDFIESVCHYR